MVLAGSQVVSLVLGQQELLPLIGFLYKAMCVEPDEKYGKKIPFVGEEIDQAINALKIFFSKDNIKRTLINTTPIGTFNIIKCFYTVIKHRKQCAESQKQPDNNSQESTQQPEQTQNNSNNKDLTQYQNREDFDIAGDRKAEADLKSSLSTRNQRIDQIRMNTRRRNKVNESKILKEYREEINNLLIPHMQKQLGFNHPPTINFAEDSENAQDMFGKTAYYNPSTSEITVYVTNRHPKDIMRSVAHEIVHHAQNQRGEFENSFNLGEEGYAQNNSHLRSMEEEAYLSGNMIFRDWEDNLKKQRNQNKMINESSLRAKIRSMIKEEMYNHTENEPAKEHDAGCECEECANKRKILKAKGNLNMQGLSEQVEKQLVPLKEWRNMELNSLLLNRFGIVSPQVLGEKKNKKPDADGDGVPDWADEKPNDPKVGAKKSKPAKKGKVPPQFLKKGKKDESK